MTEIKTVYGQLEKDLGLKITPAPDEWDRLYNVDFFIEIRGKFVGLQIKPINSSKVGDEKEIRNKEVIAEIKQEIERLKK